MGGAEAVRAAAIVCRPAAQVADAADCRGDPLPAARGSAVANAAALLSAGLDGAPLVLPVARQRAVAGSQSLSADGLARERGSRGVPQRRGERQPDRQNHGKWRPLRMPSRRSRSERQRLIVIPVRITQDSHNHRSRGIHRGLYRKSLSTSCPRSVCSLAVTGAAWKRAEQLEQDRNWDGADLPCSAGARGG
jgi:hypothetical protein